MKVRELIEILKTQPPELDVAVRIQQKFESECCCCDEGSDFFINEVLAVDGTYAQQGRFLTFELK